VLAAVSPVLTFALGDAPAAAAATPIAEEDEASLLVVPGEPGFGAVRVLERPMRVTPGFGSVVWDCALLAQRALAPALCGSAAAVAARRGKGGAGARPQPAASLRGLRVVEIGCGTGFLGLAAALRGASVLATDGLDEVLEMARANARVNSPAVAAAGGNAAAVTLKLASAVAQAWTVFANGELVGTGWELSHADGTRAIAVSVNLSTAAAAGGGAVLALLSSSLGIGNGGGVHNGTSTGVKGITSTAPRSVVLGGSDAGKGVDLTSAAPWTHVAGSVSGAAVDPALTPADAAALQHLHTLTSAPTPEARAAAQAALQAQAEAAHASSGSAAAASSGHPRRSHAR
jgi:hypothetical protein